MNSSITVQVAIITSNGVIFLIHTYIPINNIHTVDLIEYLSKVFASVNIIATQNERPKVTLVTSVDFARAMQNQIVIGKNVNRIDKK